MFICFFPFSSFTSLHLFYRQTMRDRGPERIRPVIGRWKKGTPRAAKKNPQKFCDEAATKIVDRIDGWHR